VAVVVFWISALPVAVGGPEESAPFAETSLQLEGVIQLPAVSAFFQ
jgi:hypothetical protein